MSSVLHVLKGIITADISDFAKKIAKGAQVTQQLGQAWGRAGAAIGSAATRITAAVGGMGVYVGKTFADFEAVMVRVGAVTQTLGTGQFAELEAFAQKMGETTVFSARQAAEAMELMGLAGLKTHEIIEALPGALQLAASAQVSIAQAADVAAKTMRAFGADATELTHINDVLVATFTKANTDLSQLGEALKPVAPLSKALGVSLEDTAAAIAKMSDAGFQGSMGGTALRNILSKLAGATPEVTAKLQKLGIETLDSTGKMRPFLDLLEEIEQAGLTDAKIMELFGQRGGPQLLSLLEVGSKGLREFSAEIQAAGGIAQRIAEANLNTLSGQFMIVKSAMDVIVIDTGKRLADRFRELTTSLKSFLAANRVEIVRTLERVIGDATQSLVRFIRWLKESGPQLAELARSIWTVVKAIGDFMTKHPRLLAGLMALKVSGFLGINAALSATISALGQTGAALLATLGPTAALKAGLIGLVVAGVAVLATKLYQLASSFEAVEAGARKMMAHLNALNEQQAKRFADVMRQGSEMTNAGERKSFYAEQVELAQRDLSTLEFLRDNAERELEGMSSYLDSAAYKKKQQEIDSLKASIGQTLGFIEDLGYEMAAADRELARLDSTLGDAEGVDKLKQRIEDLDTALLKAVDTRNQLHAAGDDTSAAEAEVNRIRSELEAAQSRLGLITRPDAAFLVDAVPSEDIAEALRGAIVEGIERSAPGFQKLRDFVAMEGVTGEDIATFVNNAFADVPQEYTDQLRAEFDALGPTDRQDTELVDQIVASWVQGLNQMREATELQKHNAEQAASGFRSFADRLTELHQSGQLGTDAAIDLGRQAQVLRDQFAGGSMSADQFADAMRRLSRATDEAVEAAQREEEQRRREALLRGDFRGAGLDFQQALEDRLARLRMQQFNQQVDAAFNGLMGFTDGLYGAVEGFRDMSQEVSDFGGRLANATVATGSQAAEAWNSIQNFLSSTQGRLAAIVNNISMLQQALTFANLSHQRRQEILGNIEALQQEYLDIINRPPPVSLTSAEELFTDPGLQSGGEDGGSSRMTRGSGGVSIVQNFKSLGKPDASDLRMMLDSINTELQRKGHSRVF